MPLIPPIPSRSSHNGYSYYDRFGAFHATQLRSRLALPIVALVLIMAVLPANAVTKVGKNIDITASNDPAERQQVEPTIAVDPRNPNIIVAGAQDYRLLSVGGHRWHGFYRSTDLDSQPCTRIPRRQLVPRTLVSSACFPVHIRSCSDLRPERKRLLHRHNLLHARLHPVRSQVHRRRRYLCQYDRLSDLNLPSCRQALDRRRYIWRPKRRECVLNLRRSFCSRSARRDPRQLKRWGSDMVAPNGDQSWRLRHGDHCGPEWESIRLQPQQRFPACIHVHEHIDRRGPYIHNTQDFRCDRTPPESTRQLLPNLHNPPTCLRR